MDHLTSRHVDENGRLTLPEVFITANFPSATGGNSLLRHDDVTTLFHEAGHAIHHLLSNIDELFVSGVNGIDWDTVEFPSQFLENYAYAPEVLDIIAMHFETGEPLPKALRDKIAAVRVFQTGLQLMRQVEFSLFDMLIHNCDPLLESEVQDVLNEVRRKVSPLPPPSYNKFQNGFSHIFSGGYAAGYYSYKWADRLSSDAYCEFMDKGVFNKTLSEKYRDTVLSLGASKDMGSIYQEFLGRQPDISSIFKLLGL
jgi:oligopeptidase A